MGQEPSPVFRLRMEHCPEGGRDSIAIEVYSVGEVRELTYESMDEVLKADISQAELAALTQLLANADLASDHISCALADTITLFYQTSHFWGEAGSSQFDTLFEIWNALESLSRRYFTPRFY
jgi:hypothetical protein